MKTVVLEFKQFKTDLYLLFSLKRGIFTIQLSEHLVLLQDIFQ